MGNSAKNVLMSSSEHLDAFRKMLIKILSVATILAIILFLLREYVFAVILAPRSSDFIFYRGLEHLLSDFGVSNISVGNFNINLINTEMASQFMIHLKMSFYGALLLTSPYVVYKLFKYISPALYENEKRMSAKIVLSSYILFFVGVMMSYFIVFPFSIRFLGTYQVDATIPNTITLQSYTSTFNTLTLMLGLVFQIPVLSFFLSKMGLINAALMKKYRKYAIFIIAVVAAIITPPDIFTMILVLLPMCLLYEVSILVVARERPNSD
jgi:sec-independent protein translocase protein TatC